MWALVTFACGCANRLFYHPDSRIYRTPDRDGYSYEDVVFESEDGVKLHGWFIQAVGHAEGTVIHFHGNAQNLSAHYAFVSWFPISGYNLFLFDYRGYGKSEGRPTREGVYRDSVAALRYASQRASQSQQPLFVFGQSMGGAAAITAVASGKIETVRGMVIDSAYYSHRSVAKDALRSTTAGSLLSVATPLMVSDGFDPGDWVDEISPIPIAIMHGTDDRVVPFSHGEALYAAAKEPKEFWVVQGGGHTDALVSRRREYGQRILDFFEMALAERAE